MKHIRRFGFCVYAVLRGTELIKYWRLFFETPPAQRANLGLPCIVLDLGDVLVHWRPRDDGVGGPLMRQLDAELVAGAGASLSDLDLSKYDLVVYNHGCDILPVPANVYTMSVADCAQLRSPALQVVKQHMGSSGAVQAVQPRTALYALARDYERLMESERNHMDAELARATQRIVLQTRPLQAPTQAASQPESMTTAQLFDDQTPISAMMNLAAEPQMYTLSAAAEILEEHKKAIQNVGAGKPAISAAERARRTFDRTHFMQEAINLPEFMQIGTLTTPDVINDVNKMRDQLAADIAAAYAVPIDVVIRGMSGGSGGTTAMRSERKLLGGLRTIETESDRIEHGIILRERRLAGDLFTHMYMNALAPLDIVALDDVQKDLEAYQVALDIGDESQALMQLVTQTQGKQQRKRSRERATLAEVRALIEGLQTTQDARGSIARLTFKYSRSAENSARLAGLMELFDRGLVDYTQLEEPARALFGQDIKLREPPLITAATGTGADGAPPRKKQKVSDSQQQQQHDNNKKDKDKEDE
jgi:hypothetical protein